MFSFTKNFFLVARNLVEDSTFKASVNADADQALATYALSSSEVEILKRAASDTLPTEAGTEHWAWWL